MRYRSMFARVASFVGLLAFTAGLALVGATPGLATAPEPPPDPLLPCPTIEGMGPPSSPTASYSGREGLVFVFGSTVRFSSLSVGECSYSADPSDEDPPVGWAYLSVYWASPTTIDEHRVRACTISETERDGIGVVTLGGSAAAYATYSVNASEPVDTAPFAAAARALLDEASRVASSCEGVTSAPPPATEASGLLAAAFTPDVLSGGAPAVPSNDQASDDASDQDVAASDQESTTGSSTDEQSTATTVAADSAAPGWLQALGAIAAIASLALLALTFLMIRRETRIRPAFDVARIVVIAIVAVAGTALLADATSVVAVVIAILLGFAVGAWQGSQLVVRAIGDGWGARRTGWSVIAFAVGIGITQLAARLDSAAGLTLGLSTTFLSAALATGVIVGRRGPIADARRAAAVTAIVLFTFALAAVPSRGSTRADDGDPDTVLADERSEAQTALIGLVDWSMVDIRGGLFAEEGKPAVSAGVPAALDSAPGPVTNSATWSIDRGAGPVTYTVQETYTFGLRSDGICCTVDYAGTGTTTEPAGTVYTYEAAGRLDDIQSVAIEGSQTISQAGALGVPFGEVQSFAMRDSSGDQPATADPATCGRPVAEPRGGYDLEQTGGEAVWSTYRVDGQDREPPNSMNQMTVTTDCDVPGFTPADALAVAPPPPAIDDPVRGVGCPVFQEVLGALVPASNLPGVDTITTAEAFIEPNAMSCSSGVTLGQGGPGETRHELRYQFAQPDDPAFGEDSSQIDEIYWTDLPLASDIPAELRCAVDESGIPVAPADPATAGCQQVDRYDLDGVRVFVLTDWQTVDGPNVVVFVTAPWGTYSYRCHHCTPTDPAIADFLAAFNAFAADTGEQIAAVAETMPEPDAGDTTPPAGTTDEGADIASDSTNSTETTETTETIETTDRSEPAAVAALLGLSGAAAMVALTLGEVSGWRASDAEGAGVGAESAAGDALGFLNNLASFDEALGEYQEAGYDRPLASLLAAVEVLGGNAAGDSAPFGGIGDNRLEQLGGALLPQGLQNALIPGEVVKNNIRTGLQALTAVAETLGASWDSPNWDTTALDQFVDQLEARPGADPFAGYSQAFGLVFEELYDDGGASLVQDLANLVIGQPDGTSPLFDDPGRVTRDDFVEALYESAAEFSDDVAGGKHGVVLQGLDDVFGITAELVTDPAEAIGGFVDDLANIVEHGVGDGYWSDVAAQVDSTLRDVPVVDVIYSGYQELFSGVLSHAESAEDLASGAAQADFAAEMAEGAAALGAEVIDFIQGGDNAVRAFDYVRSLF